MEQKKIRLKTGQALVEAVAAFAIVMIVLVGLLQLSNRSVTNSGEASRQALATTYVTEGLQWVKDQRLSGWPGFKAYCGNTIPCSHTYCLNQLTWSVSGTCTSGNVGNTEYQRLLQLNGANPLGKDEITATVTVSWEEAGRMVTARQTFTFVDR